MESLAGREGGGREMRRDSNCRSTRIWRLGCDDAKMQDRGWTGAGNEVKAGTNS